MKKIIQVLQGIVGPKDDILVIEDNRSLADYVEDAIRKLDFEPKLKIEKISGCPCLPWVIVEDGSYLINASRNQDGVDDEVFGFQVAFKYVRMRAQEENPNMVLFTPEVSTGIPVIDQKVAESYFNNFNDKKETDGAISSWLAVGLYINDCAEEELAKLIKLGVNEFLKFKLIRKKRND